MKVIDLLNKIANGEEVPKEIIFENYRYHKHPEGYFRSVINSNWIALTTDFNIYDILNDEVEILEEPKGIPKRIQSNGENLYSEYIGQWLINKENYTEYDELLMNKINEILDYLESKGESNE